MKMCNVDFEFFFFKRMHMVSYFSTLQVCCLLRPSKTKMLTTTRAVPNCESHFDNSLGSSAQDTKLKIISITNTENSKKNIVMNISYVVVVSRRSSCMLLKSIYVFRARSLCATAITSPQKRHGYMHVY